MLDFATFTSENWISFSLLVVQVVVCVFVICLDLWLNRKRYQTSQDLEPSIDGGSSELEASVDDLEKAHFRLGFTAGTRLSRGQGKMIKKRKYVPGELIDRGTEAMKPSPVAKFMYEIGYYDGQYEVAKELERPVYPDLEGVLIAARNTWPNTAMSLEELIDWVRNGATDPRTNEKTLSYREGEEIYEALNLINDDLFIPVKQQCI